MTLLQALLLGIVEGSTELLPVSSTAHLMVTAAVLGIKESALVSTFLISVQLGAVIAIALYYVRRLQTARVLGTKVITAFIPTALIGFIAYDVVKGYLLESLLIAGIALIVGGIVMIVIERRMTDTPEDAQTALAAHALSYKQAFIIGCLQCLALVPGVSRSGATIIGGRLLGVARRTLVEFSFLLALPVIGGAVFLDLVKTDFGGASYDMTRLLLVGMVAAGLTTWGVITWLIRYIQNHTFTVFGWYRIGIGILVLVFVALR